MRKLILVFLLFWGAQSFTESVNIPVVGGGAGGVTSINADTTAAQLITGSNNISASTAAGTTTINGTLLAPKASPIFSGQVSVPNGSIANPGLILGAAADNTGFSGVGAATTINANILGVQTLNIQANQIGAPPFFYLNIKGTAGTDAVLTDNSSSDTFTLAGDFFGDRTRGGWIRAGGRAAAMGEVVQIGTVSTVRAQVDASGNWTFNGGKMDVPFERSCTLTSAAAATPVHCLIDADVGAAQKVYLAYWHLKVNGATPWATTATCTIQDTNGTPVVFETIAVAAMAGNAFTQAGTANVTHGTAFSLGTGGTTAKGLDVVCNANGTGSDAVFTISGFMK